MWVHAGGRARWGARGGAVACVALAMVVGHARADGLADSGSIPPLPNATQPMGAPATQVVVKGARRALFRVAIPPAGGAADVSDVLVDTATRDLVGCGMFRMVDPRGLPVDRSEGLSLDVGAWRTSGVDVVVKGRSSVRGANIHVELRMYEPATGAQPLAQQEFDVAPADVHKAMHVFDDEIVRVLTGTPGSFATRLAFSAVVGRGQKGIFTVAADGRDLARVDTASNVAFAPAFGEGSIFYSGATPDGAFALFRVGQNTPVSRPQGQVTGIAFRGAKMALVVARSDQSDIYVGSLGTPLQRVTSGGLNSHPAFGPNGELVYVSDGAGNPQVYVDGRRVTMRGSYNMAPSWCADPAGAKIVFMGRDGATWDIFTVDPSGDPQSMQRLTQDQGSNTYPACSPDGRMIAFFSSRGGLYTMTTQGSNQQKVAGIMGESLRWEGN
jgi:TolB protein